MTSRGQRIALLAARGQLSFCPDEFKPLLMYMKEEGIKIEIHKELMLNIMQAHASTGNKQETESTRKAIIKYLFPEIKDQEEELMEHAKENLVKFGDTLRVRLDTTKKINPSEANRQLNKG